MAFIVAAVFVIGALFGFWVAALLAAAGRADECAECKARERDEAVVFLAQIMEVGQ